MPLSTESTIRRILLDFFAMIQIEPIYTESPLRNYSYLVSSGDGRFLAAVDPWDGADLAERIERSGRRLSHHQHP